MKDNQIGTVMTILHRVTKDMPVPYVTRLAREGADPFLILIATILSLRTRDLPTETASRQLFALATTPAAMAKLPVTAIERAIAPASFPQPKAGQIQRTCEVLVEQYGGQVPDDLEELDELPGVGRKTANLVITLGFHQLGICVDTHVHRITNRWGYVHTRTPDETEVALRAKLPKQYWIEINAVLIAFGQNICLPISPLCSTCPLLRYCDRVRVTHSR